MWGREWRWTAWIMGVTSATSVLRVMRVGASHGSSCHNASASRDIPGLRTSRMGERRRKVKPMNSYRRIAEAFPAAASPTGGPLIAMACERMSARAPRAAAGAPSVEVHRYAVPSLR